MYGGKDFDFDSSSTQTLKVLEGISPSSLDIKESQKIVQGKPFIVEDDFFTSAGRQDQSQIKLVTDSIEALSARRILTRKANEFIRV